MIKSIYIHIPFCKNICTYCDFCKIFYNEKYIDDYLNALKIEIENNYKQEQIETIYIGGGTPSSLNIKQLEKLFSILKILNVIKLKEFTFECNIDSLDENKLKYLYDNKVNRLSLGVQSFNDKVLKSVNRKHTNKDIKRIYNLARSIGFNNINIDIIYGIQSFKQVKLDIEQSLKLNPEHISCYSLSINSNTVMYINNMKTDEDLDYKMYKYIKNKLEKNEYNNYEISNYCKTNKESIHNLTYWNNDEYYGFGLGASGYINNVRYTNTKNINEYIKNNFVYEKEVLSIEDKIKYELILNLRKTEGINKKNFFNKYNIKIEDMNNIKQLILENKLIEDNDYIYVKEDWKYKLNSLLVDLI